MNKKAEIVKAAQALFGQFGLKKVTTDDISREARISKATVYRYYRNKGEIFDEVVKIEGTQMLEAIRAAVDRETTTAGKLRAHLMVKLGTIRDLTNFYRVTSETWGDYWPQFAKVRMWFMEAEKLLIRDILEYGMSRNELSVRYPDLTSQMMVVSLKWVEYPWATEGHDIALESLVDLMIDILMDGLRKR